MKREDCPSYSWLIQRQLDPSLRTPVRNQPISAGPEAIGSLRRRRTLLDRFHGSRMEGFPSTFSPYTANAVCDAPVLDSGWAKRPGRLIAPPGLNYLELCKAIIAQVNPGAGAPFRRAHTKECGVQVNAKVDKVVQCSLGPKTLFCREEGEHQHQGSPKSPHGSADSCVKALCNTPPTPQRNNLRFLRPVSIYSPAFDRRPQKLRDEGEVEVPVHGGGEESAEDGDEELKTIYNRTQRGSKFQVGVG